VGDASAVYSFTQNSSGIKFISLSGRFRQISYHYKFQDSAKMCAPAVKCHQLQGGFAPNLTLPPTSRYLRLPCIDNAKGTHADFVAARVLLVQKHPGDMSGVYLV